MAYSDKLLDHYENPRNVGTLNNDEGDIGTGLVGAPACGDVMKLQIKVDEAGIIEDAKFKTYGCGSAIASSSLVTEWVKGRTIDQALDIKNTDIVEHLSLPPVKIHCSVLAEDAIRSAIEGTEFVKYVTRHSATWPHLRRWPNHQDAEQSANQRPEEVRDIATEPRAV